MLSSDALRGLVGEHDLDLDATDDAFEIMDRMLEMRMGRGLTTVVDTTGLDHARRQGYLDLAHAFGAAAVAVRFTTSAAECRRRNRERDHPVPLKALDNMVKIARALELETEGWDHILEPTPVRLVTSKLAAASRSIGVDASREATEQAGGSSALTFGLLVSRYDMPGGSEELGSNLARVATDAEAAGFDSLWVMDHMIQIPQVGSAWDPMLESYTALGYLAGATSTIRLGVLVSAATMRNVGHLAKLVATLDVLSGGRAIAGVGAANNQREHEAYGWSFPAAPDRLARLEDVLQALPLLWGPGSPSFTGTTLSIPEAIGYPRPIQDPMPLIVGGSGERVTLRLAAQYATGCNIFGDLATVSKRVEALHAHCQKVDRDPRTVEVTHLGEVLLGTDSVDLDERIARLRPSRVGPSRYAEQVNAGTVDDHELGFRALRAAGVDTAILTTPDLADRGVFENFAELIGRFST